MKLPSHWWWDLTTQQFAELDMSQVVAVFPVAAVEQHGPHLPVRVDAAINAGIICRAVELLPDALPLLVLPMAPVGKSVEHLRYPGTLTVSYETLARMWYEIAESVHRAGCKKIVFVNSHGGQPQVMEIVCRELRVKLGMLAVSAWINVGADMSDLFSAGEMTHGIHGGEIETSVMLHLHPELVDMGLAADFRSVSYEMHETFGLLQPDGATSGFGWQAQDLHPSGTTGNAAAADAVRGKSVVERSAAGLVQLWTDVQAFDMARLGQVTDYAK